MLPKPIVNLEDHFRDMRKEIYDDMLARGRDKFKFTVLSLRAFKYLTLNPTRGSLLESYYVLMRYIDDIVDGDTQLPKNTSAMGYIEDKINFLRNPINPQDAADYLMLYCFQLAKKLGHDLSFESDDILNSLRFDAQRVKKSVILPDEQLKHHFYLLDIRGVIRATLKIFGEDYSKYTVLHPLGTASRIYYNLKDYEEDIRAGFINISAEDFKKYNMSKGDLENRLSESVQKWIADQATLGMDLLQQHRQNISKEKFKPLTKLVLYLKYERPVREYFENELKLLSEYK